MRPSYGSRGFTVVELLVAIAVGSLVLLAASTTVESVARHGSSLLNASKEQMRAANADRLLRDLAGMLEVGTAEGRDFVGTERAARFTTWCSVPRGWLERCRATIAVLELEVGVVLAVETVPGEVTLLARGFERGAIRYLAEASNGGRWLTNWDEGITVPSALGIILDADTLIVRIGERG